MTAETKTPRLDAALAQFADLLGAAKLFEERSKIERAAPLVDRHIVLGAIASSLGDAAALARNDATTATSRDVATTHVKRALRLDLLHLASSWLQFAVVAFFAEDFDGVERLATIARGLLDLLPTLGTSPYRAVELPWIWGRPGPSVVAAHAGAHPLAEYQRERVGLWLVVNDAAEHGPAPLHLELVTRGASVWIADTLDEEADASARRHSLSVEISTCDWTTTCRFLPLSATGIPTCFLYPAPAVDPEAKPIRHVETAEALKVARALLHEGDDAIDARDLFRTDEKAARVLEAVVRERDHHLHRVGELLAANTAAKMRQRAIARLVPAVRCTACSWAGTVAQTMTRGDVLACPQCSGEVAATIATAERGMT